MRFSLFMYCTVGRRAELEAGMAGRNPELSTTGGTSDARFIRNYCPVLEFGLIVTQIGTAVVIFPLVRRQSETVSLGYVTARIMESAFIAIGLMSIVSVVSVNDALVGASGAQATALAARPAEGGSWRGNSSVSSAPPRSRMT